MAWAWEADFVGGIIALMCPSLDVGGRKEYEDLKPLVRKTWRGGKVYTQNRQEKPGDFTEYLCGSSGEMDSEGQRDQVLSLSPAWLK